MSVPASSSIVPATLLLLALPAASAWADEPAALGAALHAGEWTLFEPTPDTEMRPLAVETVPFTLDPGHVQLEVDLVNAAWEGAGGGLTDRRVDLFGINARLGLTRDIDAQVQLVPTARPRSRATPA